MACYKDEHKRRGPETSQNGESKELQADGGQIGRDLCRFISW